MSSPKRVPSADGSRYTSDHGALVLVEECHKVPLVDVQITLRTGTVHDPKGLDGLTRMTWRTARMGTGRLHSHGVEEAIASLGARLSMEVGTSFVRLHGSVIRRNLEAFCDLLFSLAARPAFRTADIAQVKRETLAEIVSIRDNDKALAGRHFRSFLFANHAYGRSPLGTAATIRAAKPDHLRVLHDAHFVASNTIVGFAGDVTLDAARLIVDRAGELMCERRAPRDRVPEPRMRRGRRLLLVDKPERTQTQVFIGTLGSRIGDRDYIPLNLANTAFGGTFTARMMREIRSKRGWSYGANSRLGQDRRRDAWLMYTFPAAKDAVDCIRLELELLERWVSRGITAKERAFATDYICNGFCFEKDTAMKRLDTRTDVELFGLPADYYDRYVDRVRAVSRTAANRAVRARINPEDLVITLVASAKDLEPALRTLPGLRSFTVVRWGRS